MVNFVQWGLNPPVTLLVVLVGVDNHDRKKSKKSKVLKYKICKQKDMFVKYFYGDVRKGG